MYIYIHAQPTQNLEKAQREQLQKRFRVANTMRLFKQNRFNLLHEESEGYAKVRYMKKKELKERGKGAGMLNNRPLNVLVTNPQRPCRHNKYNTSATTNDPPPPLLLLTPQTGASGAG
jgi:hypothetical protein